MSSYARHVQLYQIKFNYNLKFKKSEMSNFKTKKNYVITYKQPSICIVKIKTHSAQDKSNN